MKGCYACRKTKGKNECNLRTEVIFYFYLVDNTLFSCNKYIWGKAKCYYNTYVVHNVLLFQNLVQLNVFSYYTTIHTYTHTHIIEILTEICRNIFEPPLIFLV